MSTEYDITVIGAGPGGYVAALKAARMGARVAIVEKGHLGGACLNVGCIPSKALLASAELLHKIRAAGSMGVKVHGGIEFDWAKIQKRKDKVIRKLRGGIKGLLGAGDVHLMTGTATFKAAGTLTVTTSEGKEETIQTKNTIIATGSVPARVPGWPTDPQWVCTSDEALHWQALPKRLLIVGRITHRHGKPIGRRLGGKLPSTGHPDLDLRQGRGDDRGADRCHGLCFGRGALGCG